MKLYYSPTSPFVRIVHIAAREKGLMDRIELIPARAEGADLDARNPLDKIPTLITDEGETLIESRLIAAYLDELGPPRLYPDDAVERRCVLQREAVVLGVMEAVGLRRQETRRPEPERSAWWIGRQMAKIERGLAKIEAELDAFTAGDGIVAIELCCALEFMDRFAAEIPEFAWRTGHPRLAAWHAAFAERPSVAATRPGPA
ncbi:MAG: glutathione S-transferase family protein [Alphaproteobacteria bacterium]|nr:glutathione S-transferase family protein [Alphaproteobacteria bacterium]